MESKRLHQRRRALKSGKIIFAGGSFSVDCIIRNISETGARLQVPTAVAIPDHFKLVDAHGGAEHQVAVVWRRGELIGVSFASPGSSSGRDRDAPV